MSKKVHKNAKYCSFKKFVMFRCFKNVLCPFAVYFLRYTVTSFFTISRISLADGKTAGQKVHRKIAVAVQNVKPLYFLSRSFKIREKYCSTIIPQYFLIIAWIKYSSLPGFNTLKNLHFSYYCLD